MKTIFCTVNVFTSQSEFYLCIKSIRGDMGRVLKPDILFLILAELWAVISIEGKELVVEQLKRLSFFEGRDFSLSSKKRD